MTFNLLDERWIPVVRQSGDHEWISPCQLTAGIDENPIRRLAAPRPDFNGALIQFLIGLVQTTMTPESHREWRQYAAAPPPPAGLKSSFARYQDAFNLDGEGPRFMQDFDRNLEGTNFAIDRLLIDAPGDQSVKRNIDHYVHRRPSRKFGPAASATALMCLQMNAPSGGQGHRTSLRGGGPLTSLLVGRNSLWETVWLNIVTREQLQNLGGKLEFEMRSVFPWLSTTRSSENDERVTPSDVSVLQVYWATPRRIRLMVEVAPSEQVCDLYMRKEKLTCAEFCMRPYGPSYDGNWRHPLTPYSTRKDGALNPLKTRSELPGYRDWIGLLLRQEDGGSLEPATVIQSLQNDRAKVERAASRLWVFGYSMDNMKPLRWVDSQIPMILLEGKDIAQIEKAVRRLIECAEVVQRELRAAIKSACLSSGKDLFQASWSPTAGFWTRTEGEFLGVVRSLLADASKVTTEWPEVAVKWLKFLSRVAEEMFNDAALLGDVDFVKWKRICTALQTFRRQLSPSNSKIRKVLDLPAETAQASRPRGRQKELAK